MSLTVTLEPEEVAELRIALQLDICSIRACGAYDDAKLDEKLDLCNGLIEKLHNTHTATYCPSPAVLGGTNSNRG